VSLSVIDIIFIILVFLFMLRCFLKGFISEILMMAAIVFGIFASVFFHKNGGAFLRERYFPEISASIPIPEILAFIALFLIVFVIFKLLEIMLKGIISGVNLGGADKFLGFIFGFIEGIVVVSLVLIVMQIIKPIYDPSFLFEDSLFAKILLPLINETGIKRDV